MSPSTPSRVRCWILAALFLSFPVSAPAEPRYWVIVHPDNPATALERDEISKIFLKKTTKWKDGATAVPVDLVEKAPARQAFSKDIHHRPASVIKKYWQQKVFSGQAAPPPEVPSEDDVLTLVSADPAAIGYVSDEAVLRGVKILDVVDPPPAPRVPAAASYPSR